MVVWGLALILDLNLSVGSWHLFLFQQVLLVPPTVQHMNARLMGGSKVVVGALSRVYLTSQLQSEADIVNGITV